MARTRWIVIVVALLAFLPAVATAAPPTSTPMPTPTAAERASCDDLDAYQDVLTDATQDVPYGDLAEMMEGDPFTVRPSQMRSASLIFDDLAARWEGIPDDDVPLIARGYHDAAIDAFSILSSAFNAMAANGPTVLLMYTEEIEMRMQVVEDAEAYIVATCGTEPPVLFPTDANRP